MLLMQANVKQVAKITESLTLNVVELKRQTKENYNRYENSLYGT